MSPWEVKHDKDDERDGESLVQVRKLWDEGEWTYPGDDKVGNIVKCVEFGLKRCGEGPGDEEEDGGDEGALFLGEPCLQD